MNRIVQRYRSFLVQSYKPSEDHAEQYAASLSKDGTWADIDYGSRHRAGWQPASHLTRVRVMAMRLAAGRQTGPETEALHQAIDRALDHWFAKRYQAPNWWWNEIGVPRAMRDIVVLLNNDLNGPRRQAAIEVIGQYRVSGTGANLVWTAELALHQGCLTGNAPQVAEAAKRIWNEVTIGQPEGIQNDYSFFQHHQRLQTFHYGHAFLDVVAKLAWQNRQTPWSIPADKRDILSRYILEGPQWMCQGIYTCPGTMDRASSRQNSLRSADLRTILSLWREVDPQRREAIDRFLARQNGQGEPLCGFKYFPDADFTAYHRPECSVFLKTISSRTRFTESINGENLKGAAYLNCSDHYVLRDGQEYFDLPPVWDYKRLPGLTLPAFDTDQQRCEFVGGLGDGQSGLTAMDYVRGGEKGALKVRKLWAFHGDLVVCLLAGWRVSPASQVTTAIEQCRLRGNVQTATADGHVKTLTKGKHQLGDVRWILHNGIGYIPLGHCLVNVSLGEATGSWHQINRQYPDEKVHEPVLRIEMQHDKAPKPTGFIIMLGANKASLEKLTSKPTWQILHNDDACQCIRFGKDLTMAGFYKGYRGHDPSIAVSKPCLAMWSQTEMRLCDPTHKGEEVAVTWQGSPQKVRLPEAGRAAAVQMHQ